MAQVLVLGPLQEAHSATQLWLYPVNPTRDIGRGRTLHVGFFRDQKQKSTE